MLKNKQVIFHIKRKAMRNVYIDCAELDDLVNNCRPAEIKLYNLLVQSVLLNPSVEYFSTSNLALSSGLSVDTIKKARANLINQGYILLCKFKDESNEPMIRVIVGKEQVELYNLGLKVEIQDAKAYKKLVQEFDFTNPALSTEVRKERVTQANHAYMSSPQSYT